MEKFLTYLQHTPPLKNSYLAAIFDVSLIAVSLNMADAILRTTGLVIGVIVGILTMIKLIKELFFKK